MKFKHLLVFFAILSFCHLQAQVNVRLGGSVGNGLNKGLFDLEGQDFNVDKSNLAWKTYLDVYWKYLGVSAGYRDLGSVKVSNLSGQGSSQSQGVNIFALGRINAGPFEIFAKAGPYVGKTHNELHSITGTEILNEIKTEASLAWGVGTGLNMGFLHLRLEYEKLQLSTTELALLSLGAGIKF